MTAATIGEWVKMGPQDIGSSIYNDMPLTQDRRDFKIKSLEEAVRSQNLGYAQMLAMSREGLVNDDFRKALWPLLLQITPNESPESKTDWRTLPKHKDEHQMFLDSDRAFVHFPQTTDDIIDVYKLELLDLMVAVMRRNPSLSYYQGYHDVAQIMYLIFGRDDAIPILEYVTLYFLRDFMMPCLDATLDHLTFVPALLKASDPELAAVFKDIVQYIGLSSVITIFTHDVKSYRDLCVILDYVFASRNMAIPIYLYTSIIIDKKQKFLESCNDEEAGPLGVLNTLFTYFPENDSVVFNVTALTTTLFEQYPPQGLAPWAKLSQYSVLKTTAAPPFALIQEAAADTDDDEAQQPEQTLTLYNSSESSNSNSNGSSKNSSSSRLNKKWTQNSFFPLFSSESNDQVLDISIKKAPEEEAAFGPENMADSVASSVNSLFDAPKAQPDSFYNESLKSSASENFLPRKLRPHELEDKVETTPTPQHVPHYCYTLEMTLDILNRQILEDNVRTAEREAQEKKERQRLLEERQRQAKLREAREKSESAKDSGSAGSSSKAIVRAYHYHITALTKLFSSKLVGLTSASETAPRIWTENTSLVSRLLQRTGLRALSPPSLRRFNFPTAISILYPSTVVSVSIYVSIFGILATWYMNNYALPPQLLRYFGSLGVSHNTTASGAAGAGVLALPSQLGLLRWKQVWTTLVARYFEN